MDRKEESVVRPFLRRSSSTERTTPVPRRENPLEEQQVKSDEQAFNLSHNFPSLGDSRLLISN